MSKEMILQEIHKLSLSERLYVLEQAIKDIRLEKENGLAVAAAHLYVDYKTDENLIAFTALDTEPFYETRWNLACFIGSYCRFGNT